MVKIVERRPNSLSDYLSIVEEYQKSTDTVIWFRGASKMTHNLTPSLFRHPKIETVSEFNALEFKTMNRFRQRSIPYHSRDLKDDWEALFYMQHYGVPTRLLDWTENPLIGLFFALIGSSPPSRAYRIGAAKRSNAAVWMLNPDIWNQTALQHVSFKDGPLPVGHELLGGYAPGGIAIDKISHPVAMLGSHNSPRIVAQRGVFVMFGTGRTSMQELVRKGRFPKEALIRMVFPPNKAFELRNSLLNQGITESTVFPDLEGLAQETKRHFEFEV